MAIQRRRFPVEPPSRLAIWARRIALFSIPVALISIAIGWLDLLEIVPAVATFGGALALALLAILLSFGAFVVIWREGAPGLRHALTALFIALLMLAYPAYFAIRGYRAPPLYDITTDPVDPPRFEAIARLRSRDANPVAYAGLRAAELQRAAYPDIEPLVVSNTPQETYDAALTVITKRKWRVVESRAPQVGRRDGHIEAIVRAFPLGLRDDVVVRIRRGQDGARVDIRSASRYGLRDFGTNARRVRALIEDIEDTAGSEDNVPKKPAPKVPKSNQPPAKGRPTANR